MILTLGDLSELITCPECMGLKTDISGSKCETCEGFGQIQKGAENKSIDIFDPNR